MNLSPHTAGNTCNAEEYQSDLLSAELSAQLNTLLEMERKLKQTIEARDSYRRKSDALCSIPNKWVTHKNPDSPTQLDVQKPLVSGIAACSSSRYPSLSLRLVPAAKMRQSSTKSPQTSNWSPMANQGDHIYNLAGLRRSCTI